MSFHTALIQKLFQEEYHRTDQTVEVPYAANMKGGGEAYLIFEVPPKTLPKKGTYKIEAQLHKNVFVVRSHRTARLYAMKIEWLSEKDGKIVELNNEEENLIIPDAKDVIIAPSTKTTKIKKAFAGNDQEDTFQKTDVTAPSVSKASIQVAEPPKPKPVVTTPIRFSGKTEAKNSPFQYTKQPPQPEAPYANLVINGNKVIEQKPPPVHTPPISPSPFSPTSPSNPTSPSPNASPVANPSANVDPLQAEKNRVQREKMELQMKLDAAKMGQSKVELEKMRREKEELAAKLAALQAGKNDVERLEREQREKKELQMKSDAAKVDQSKDELEKIRREKEELMAKVAALEAGKEDQDRLERERQAKAELEQKLKAMEAEQEQARLDRERKENAKLAAKFEEMKNNNTKEALEKELREKAELEAKIAELEAQKKRDAEAEAANAAESPPAPQPTPKTADPKMPVQSMYADNH
ncbi:hypothetical protein M3Y95_00384200 [Aphelenchoides besseyi]|nr:hypothetical protein M3Y95_00384200 [Aphelenchoides besseyi]